MGLDNLRGRLGIVVREQSGASRGQTSSAPVSSVEIPTAQANGPTVQSERPPSTSTFRVVTSAEQIIYSLGAARRGGKPPQLSTS